eukprot:366503-Chlamydomonas_euryale.AAC.3
MLEQVWTLPCGQAFSNHISQSSGSASSAKNALRTGTQPARLQSAPLCSVLAATANPGTSSVEGGYLAG